MKYIEVPAPITLSDLSTGKPLKVQKVIDGKVELIDASPCPLHTFVLDHLTPSFKGFKEYKSGGRILRALEEAEANRVDGAAPIAVIDDEDHKLLLKAVDGLQLNGYQGMQFVPFMEAIEGAKSEKPKTALKSVEEPKGA